MNTQYLYLTSSCPETCTCGNKKSIKQWRHKKCNTRAKVNIRGDIFCDGGCEPFFIQNAKFECTTTKNCGLTYASYKNISEILTALSYALQSAGFDIQASHDQQEFIRILMVEAGNRWIH